MEQSGTVEYVLEVHTSNRKRNTVYIFCGYALYIDIFIFFFEE